MTAFAYRVLSESRYLSELRAGFRDATGLWLKLAPGGHLSEPGQRAVDNPFCALMKANVGACAACLRINEDLRFRLNRKLTPHQICCFAGLIELAVPVLVGGDHVATLIGGQVFRDKPDQPKFQRLIQQFRHWGLDKELPRLEKAFFHTPVLSKRQLDGALRILVVMAAQLGDFANRKALGPQSSEPDPVSRAKQFVNASLPQTAKLDEVSRHVGLSRNHFCRVFKHGTGITFTEYLARLRVEKAKELLADVRVRITEAADRAGFNSISQFNRIFRRYAGSSPTEYRRRLPAPAKLA